MSLRLEMLQVARLAPKLLGDSTRLVADFLRGQQNPDGGFKDRTGRSDLYYTVFGLDGLAALQADLPIEPVRRFLEGFGDGASLDFVHLCCLARSWASLSTHDAKKATGANRPWPVEMRRPIWRRIERHRADDGGFAPAPHSLFGTAYGCFLAMGACQDLQFGLPVPESGLADCLGGLQTHDGAWANDRSAKTGSTNATAAAVQVLRHLGRPLPAAVGHWLKARCHPQGGFLATPTAPIPDLLSSATALHALAALQTPCADIQERCLDFIDSLWTNQGAFHGHWSDDHVDCEYTFYGLLALGHLSL